MHNGDECFENARGIDDYVNDVNFWVVKNWSGDKVLGADGAKVWFKRSKNRPILIPADDKKENQKKNEKGSDAAKNSPTSASAVLPVSPVLEPVATPSPPNDPIPAQSPPSEPKTKNVINIDQVVHRLAEGLAAKDWKVIEASAKELKALNLSPVELDATCLRVERQAALDVLASGWLENKMIFRPSDALAQILAGGLAVRAVAGDDKALAKLRTLSETKINPAGSEPLSPNASASEKRDYWACYSDEKKKDTALLFLMLLKDPGIDARVWSALLEKKAAGAWETNTDTLVSAVLTNDPQAGLKKILALYEAPINQNNYVLLLAVMQSLYRLVKTHYSPYQLGGPNCLDTDISASLSQDLPDKLVRAYIAMLNKCTTDIQSMGSSPYSLLQLLYQNPSSDELLIAVEALKTKATARQGFQHLVEQLDIYLKQQRKKNDESSASQKTAPCSGPKARGRRFPRKKHGG